MESATFSEYAGLMVSHSLTSSTEPAPDSATLDSQRGPWLQTPYPAVAYAPHTVAGLQDFLVRLARESGGAMLASLPGGRRTHALHVDRSAVSVQSRAGQPSGINPDLRRVSSGCGRLDSESNWPARLQTDLQAELRWRNCRGMGQDPIGGVRRGRLLQLVARFRRTHHAGRLTPAPAQTGWEMPPLHSRRVPVRFSERRPLAVLRLQSGRRPAGIR